MFSKDSPPKGMPFSSACMASSSMRRNPGEALGGVCMPPNPGAEYVILLYQGLAL